MSTDGGLRGLGLLLNLLREFELEPILRDGGTPHRAIPCLLAPEYLCGLVGKQVLPEFAVDLSFGALGLHICANSCCAWAFRPSVPMLRWCTPR